MIRNYPILYTFRRCPYAMRARLALYTARYKVYLREIVLRDKPDHMLEISPKGTVPVLLLPDGSVIEESLEIMGHALKHNDPEGWMDSHAKTTCELINRNDNEFKYALDRYKYPNRYPDEDCSGMFERGAEILGDLNERIDKNGGNLVLSKPTLADIAIFPFIRQFANVDRERFEALPHPALQNWLKTHLDSEIFQAIMPKFKPWKNTQETILWP
ncbi:MAG: glutathione S-transferase [Alphaproteobacteria bacterium]